MASTQQYIQYQGRKIYGKFTIPASMTSKQVASGDGSMSVPEYSTESGFKITVTAIAPQDLRLGGGTGAAIPAFFGKNIASNPEGPATFVTGSAVVSYSKVKINTDRKQIESKTSGEEMEIEFMVLSNITQ